jgi:hypothetical protein
LIRWSKKRHIQFQAAKRAILRILDDPRAGFISGWRGGRHRVTIEGWLIRAYLLGRKNGRKEGIREGIQRAKFREPAVLDY